MECPGPAYIYHKLKSDWIKIWGLGDTHRFTKAHDEKLLRKDINFIKNDPYSFWVGLGDYNESMHVDDKRFSARMSTLGIEDYDDIVEKVEIDMVDLFKPIAHKCLGLVIGNHEQHFMKRHNCGNMVRRVCKALDVRYLGYYSKFDVISKRSKGFTEPTLSNKLRKVSCGATSVRMHARHGSGGSTTNAGRRTKLEKIMKQDPDSDIVMMGHMHNRDQVQLSVMDLSADGRNLDQMYRVGIVAGAYYKTHVLGETTYAEAKDYEPVNMGMHGVRVKFEAGHDGRKTIIEALPYSITSEKP